MRTTEQQNIIDQAISILESEFKTTGIEVSSVTTSAQFLRLQIGGKEHEVFAVMFLNAQLHLIEFEIMFRGTISSASVYPREVAKRALELNAASVIFSHNHPSGNTEPSVSDRAITDKLVSALALFDVRVNDHIIVSPTHYTSFAERGLL